MRASRFVKIAVLLDEAEMAALFSALGSFQIFEVGKVTKTPSISAGEFLALYAPYVEKLRKGEVGELPLSMIFTKEPPLLQAHGERFLAKPMRPAIFLQRGCVRYSRANGEFQTGVLGESISWGVQFSYPFLFQDEAGEIFKVDDSFPNTELFLTLQRFIRHHTKATPFLVGDKQIKVPIRLGKSCFSWINNHPQLEDLAIAC